MDIHNRDLNEKQLAALNRLIREANRLHDKGFIRPSDDAIDAYLLGTPTDQQTLDIQAALEISPEFRREFAAMAEDLERLSDPDLQKKDDQLRVTNIPDLMPDVLPHAERSGAHMTSPQNWRRFLTLPNMIPVLGTMAVAALLLVVYNQRQSIDTFEPGSESTSGARSEQPGTLKFASLELIQSQVPPERLSSEEVRGGSEHDMATLAPTAESAALEEIKLLLKRDPETYLYHIVTADTIPAVREATRRLSIYFVDSLNRVHMASAMDLPRNADLDSVTLWVLALPGGSNYRLYAAPMAADTMRVIWNPDWGREAAVTLTFRDGKGYRAVKGFTFKL